MALANLGSIATAAYNRIPEIPSAASGNMLEWAFQALKMAENMLGISIGSVDIAEKYQPLLINYACALTLANMEQIGLDVSQWSIGEISVSRGGKESPKGAMIQFYLDLAKMDVRMLSNIAGRYGKANG